MYPFQLLFQPLFVLIYLTRARVNGWKSGSNAGYPVLIMSMILGCELRSEIKWPSVAQTPSVAQQVHHSVHHLYTISGTTSTPSVAQQQHLPAFNTAEIFSVCCYIIPFCNQKAGQQKLETNRIQMKRLGVFFFGLSTIAGCRSLQPMQ